MSYVFPRGVTTVHRIDVPCESTGFTPPPFDVHLKFLPPAAAEGWTLVAHAAAGRPDALALWLRPHPGIEQVMTAPGIAPKVLRARTRALPSAWAHMAAHVRVHHLDLAPDGTASWFIEGDRARIALLAGQLQASLGGRADVRCRAVQGAADGPAVSRRQFEALASAVSMGYYEIPHHIDLRTLASRTSISLGSVSELLRRAERAIITHYVDSRLLNLPPDEDEPFRPLDNVLRR